MKYIWTVSLSIISIFLALIALISMGGGHGSYDPVFILFPFGTFNVIFEDRLSDFLLFFGLLQYPMYGALLDMAREKNNIEKVAALILIVHVVLVCLIFVFKNSTNWQ